MNFKVSMSTKVLAVFKISKCSFPLSSQFCGHPPNVGSCVKLLCAFFGTEFGSECNVPALSMARAKPKGKVATKWKVKEDRAAA